MINFDAVDLSESHSEEVISFFDAKCRINLYQLINDIYAACVNLIG